MHIDEQVRVSLTGDITTGHAGLVKLFCFEQACRQHRRCTIAVDLENLRRIDANLSAVFGAILHRLHESHQLDFSFDQAELRGRFSILARNGFGASSAIHLTDGYGTAIQLRSFSAEEDDDFIDYIENQLLAHESLQLHPAVRSDMMSSFNEVFANVNLHAATTAPIFTCGQHYFRKGLLRFSLVDLGIGYLNPIQRQIPVIDTYDAAIRWALQAGNTTRVKEQGYHGVTGGFGLTNLHQHCQRSNGELQIISGNAFWSSSSPTFCQDIEPFQGTIVNIMLPCPNYISKTC